MPERTFDNAPASARQARRFARALLEPYSEDVARSAELLVSELATNVIRHTSTPFAVDVTVDGDCARIGVADGVGVDLQVKTAASDDTSGRGLQLVARLALSWGVEHTGTGKRVWFELPISGDRRLGGDGDDATSSGSVNDPLTRSDPDAPREPFGSSPESSE